MATPNTRIPENKGLKKFGIFISVEFNMFEKQWCQNGARPESRTKLWTKGKLAPKTPSIFQMSV